MIPQPTTTQQLLEMPASDLAKRLDQLRTIREVRMLESHLWDEFGGSDAIFRLMRERYGDRGEWVAPINTSSDRKGGANRPVFYNEVQLNGMRQDSRVLLQANPYAKGLHRNLLNYIVGKGMSFKIKPRDAIGPDGLPRQIDDATKAVVAKVQKWVDGWLGRNRWTATVRDPRTHQKISQSREREMVSRVLRDGEAFIRIHDLGDGDSAARFVEPVQVTNPPEATERDGWLYGIKSQTEPFVDVETEEAFWCRYWDAKGIEDGDLVPAKDIIHVMLEDEDAVTKRGIPMYAFGVRAAFERAWKLQDTSSRTAEFQSGNAEMWSSETGVPAGGNMTAYGAGPGGGGGTFVVDKFAPPPRIRYMSGRTPVTPTAMNLMEFGGVAQRDLMQAAAVVGAPEYLVSGDASNANYASTEQAGTPFVLGNAVAQEHYATASISVLYRAIQIAVDAGVLPADTLDVVEIHAETAKDDSREPLERAQEDQILTGGKPIKSAQTAMRERGLDPDQQMREMDQWNEKYGNTGMPLDPNADPYAQGRQPPPAPGMESWLLEELGKLPPYRDASTRPEIEDPPPLPEHLKAVVDKLPAPVRVPLQRTHAALMLGHNAGLAAAKSVATARGFSPEQTDSLAKRLAHYDLLISGGAKAAAFGGLHAAAPLAAVPVASLGYLTYSTLRDPAATYKAAANGVRTILDRRKTTAPAAATNPE